MEPVSQKVSLTSSTSPPGLQESLDKISKYTENIQDHVREYSEYGVELLVLLRQIAVNFLGKAREFVQIIVQKIMNSHYNVHVSWESSMY